MKHEFRYIISWITILFSAFLVGEICAQDHNQTLKFADEKYAEGNYEVALKAYQRLAFFSDTANPSIFIKVAEIAATQGDYDVAQKYYGFAINQTENDSIRYELLFKKAYYQMLNGNYQYAIVDLLSIDDTHEETKDRVNFYLGTCYFGLEDFETSRMYFKECILPEYHEEIDRLFTKRNLYSPSPSKAKIFSIILPGGGQFYSGYVKAGINSFLLTSGLIGVLIHSANSYNFLYAVVSVMPWLQRYYMGGYGRAENMAKMRRQSKRSRVYNELINLLHNRQ